MEKERRGFRMIEPTDSLKFERSLLLIKLKLDFLYYDTLFNTTSSAALRIQLCRRMQGLNPELLQRLHWQSDDLTSSRLDFNSLKLTNLLPITGTR